MKIEITSPVNARTFNNVTYYSQDGYIHSDDKKYPEKISISLESENKGYQQGFYILDLEKNSYIGQYDALTFARYLSLTPAKG